MYELNWVCGNLILATGVVAWAVAQLAKGIIQRIVEGAIDWKRFLEGGGMPSSHTAFVVACACTTGAVCGFGSPIFAIAVALSLVVMYDACHVRQETGKQAQILNFFKEQWEGSPPEVFDLKLKVMLGHTPLQVFFGALVGIVISTVGINLAIMLTR